MVYKLQFTFLSLSNFDISKSIYVYEYGKINIKNA